MILQSGEFDGRAQPFVPEFIKTKPVKQAKIEADVDETYNI